MDKLGIVGVGHVGQMVAYTACLRNIAKEIKLVDIDEQKAKSQCFDLKDAMSFYNKSVKISYNKYEDLANCDVIVISIGSILATKDRLGELDENIKIVSSFIPDIVNAGFKGKFIVVTNPCDIIAYKVMQLSNLPKNHIISSGTALDSSRLRTIISDNLYLSPKSISAYMLGEHGDSQFVAWSKVEIFGKKLDDYLNENPKIKANFDKEKIQTMVRDRGWEVYMGKKSTEFGIANTVCNIIQSILNDEKEIQLVSTYLNGQYGLYDIYLSTPCVIGKDGVEKILEIELVDDEKQSLNNTANIIRKYINKVK